MADHNFYLHDAVHILRSNGTTEHADACEWAVTELESLRAALECARDALDAFADEPVETRIAMTEHEHFLFAARREVHQALRGRDLSKPNRPTPATTAEDQS